MRGSPWHRCLFLLVALIGVGCGLWYLARPAVANSPVAMSASTIPDVQGKVVIPYELMFSSPIQSGLLDSTLQQISLTGISSHTQTGTITFSTSQPQLSLSIEWQQPAAQNERRFAKLSLFPPGKKQLDYVFDAAGNMDEFIELQPEALE